MKIEKIDYKQSILFRRVYRNTKTLKSHINKLLVEDYDTILIYKFKSHYPSVTEVVYNLDFIDFLIDTLANRKGEKNTMSPFSLEFSTEIGFWKFVQP